MTAEFGMGNEEAPHILVEQFGRTEASYADAGRRLVALAVPFYMQRFFVTNELFSRFIAGTEATGQRYITTWPSN